VPQENSSRRAFRDADQITRYRSESATDSYKEDELKDRLDVFMPALSRSVEIIGRIGGYRGRTASPSADLQRISLLFGAVLPVSRDVSARLVQVHMLVDMIYPIGRDEMVMLTIGRALLSEFDLVGAVEVIDLANGLLVR
jgi:hypothetical protein